MKPMSTNQKTSIMIIDDDHAFRLSIKAFLEDLDYAVIEAQDWRTASACFEQKQPDLILLDLRLPDVDGLKIAALLNQRMDDLPIIVISGKGSMEDAIKLLRLGAWDYFCKPIEDLALLEHSIKKALERYHLIQKDRLHQVQLEQEVKKRTLELERSYENLAEQKEQFRCVLENSRDIIYRLNLKTGKYDYLSPSSERLFGVKKEDGILLGQEALEQAVHLGSLTQANSRLEQLRCQDSTTIEYQLKQKNGEFRWVSDHCSVIFDDDGTAVAAVGNARDITEQKKADQERCALEAKIEQAQKIESLGVLAGGLAHDFNNLMTIVLTNIGMIKRLQEYDASLVDSIQKAAKRAVDLTEQMTDYAGKGHYPMEVMELSNEVNLTTYFLKLPQYENIEVTYNLSYGETTIVGDATQMQNLVKNLVQNAVESMEDRKGVIRVSTGTRHFSRDELKDFLLGEELAEGKSVYFEITDEGCGINQENQGKILEPFFSTKFIGRGLGLPACIGILRRHKGALRFRSASGEGSTFTVVFPSIWEAHQTRTEKNSNRGTVLFVDDEEMMRLTASYMLDRMGFSALLAKDGEEALGLFRENPDQIACILLDVVMPNMTGEQCLAAMRQIRKDVKVIMMSGYSDEKMVNRFSNQGRTSFLPKPYQYNQLYEKIIEAIEA